MRLRAIATGMVLSVVMGMSVSPAGAQGTGADLKFVLRTSTTSPKAGEMFTMNATVTNNGSGPAETSTLELYLSDALEITAVSATDATDTCDAGEWNYVCDLGTVRAGESASFAFTVIRTKARETWADGWVSSPSEVDTLRDNWDSIQLEPDRSNPADVGITGSAPDQPEVDETFEYTLVVKNRGPERAHDVETRFWLSEGTEYVSDSSSDPTDVCSIHENVYDPDGLEGGPYVERYLECSLGSMPAAAQTTLRITAIRRDPHELHGYADVSTASFDDNYDNDYVDLNVPGHPSVTSDLMLRMSGPAGAPLVGTPVKYQMTLTNAGPAPAPDVILSTYMPQELTLDALTPQGMTCTQDEWAGITCDAGTLEVGETVALTVSATRTYARDIWMSAWVETPNYDPTYENNYAEIHTSADKSEPVDVSVDLTGPVEPAVGSTFEQTFAIANAGPSVAHGVTLIATVPEGASYVSSATSDEAHTCQLIEQFYDGHDGELDSNGDPFVYRELHCALGDVVSGGRGTVTLTLERTAENDLWSSGYVSTTSWDENSDNDWAEWSSTGETSGGGCYADGSSEDTAEKSMIACDEAKSGGADNIDYETGSSGAPRVLSSGAGSDTIKVDAPNGGREGRTLVIRTGRGNDKVTLNGVRGITNLTVIVRTGRGNDSVDVNIPHPGRNVKVIVRSGAGRDVMHGSGTSDRFWGGPGRDELFGGDGNDRLAGGTGRDLCIGGAGFDRNVAC